MALLLPPPLAAGDCDCGSLPPPDGDEAVVTVGTIEALQTEISNASGKKTIYLQNGIYYVSGEGVRFDRPDITIRSLSGNRDDVVIQGEGIGAGGLGFGITVYASRITVADLTVREVQNHGVFIDPANSPSDLACLIAVKNRSHSKIPSLLIPATPYFSVVFLGAFSFWCSKICMIRSAVVFMKMKMISPTVPFRNIPKMIIRCMGRIRA